MPRLSTPCALLLLLVTSWSTGCGDEATPEEHTTTQATTHAHDEGASARPDMGADASADASAAPAQDAGATSEPPSRDAGAEVEPPNEDAGTPPEPAPDTIDCAVHSAWPDASASGERELVALLNVERARGARCGNENFPAAPPLKMNAALQIAARCHTLDMLSQGGLDHTGSDGSSFGQRAKRAGYTGQPLGENIAAGNEQASRTVAQWMGSPGHCRNIMKAGADRVGIGYAADPTVRYTHFWTLVPGKGGSAIEWWAKTVWI